MISLPAIYFAQQYEANIVARNLRPDLLPVAGAVYQTLSKIPSIIPGFLPVDVIPYVLFEYKPPFPIPEADSERVLELRTQALILYDDGEVYQAQDALDKSAYLIYSLVCL